MNLLKATPLLVNQLLNRGQDFLGSMQQGAADPRQETLEPSCRSRSHGYSTNYLTLLRKLPLEAKLQNPSIHQSSNQSARCAAGPNQVRFDYVSHRSIGTVNFVGLA